MIIYSSNCPKCIVLKKKLEQKNITFTECNDFQKLLDANIKTLPVLEVDNKLLTFNDAVNYVDNL